MLVLWSGAYLGEGHCAMAPDPAPRGGIPGPCPPTDCFSPPKQKLFPPGEDCAPKKLMGSGLLERKLRPKLVFFVDFHQFLWRFWDEDLFFGDHPYSVGKTTWISDFGRRIPWNSSEELFFGDHLYSAGKTSWTSDFGRRIPWNSSEELFFFWRSLVFGRKNHLNLRDRKIPSNFSEDLFFGDHLYSAGKTTWITDFGRKITLNFCTSPCFFDLDRDKFLVPPCPFRIHTK